MKYTLIHEVGFFVQCGSFLTSYLFNIILWFICFHRILYAILWLMIEVSTQKMAPSDDTDDDQTAKANDTAEST